MAAEKGIGKCQEGHPGSFGYPTRPEEPYEFCAQCGKPMVWECPSCGAGLPEDSGELDTALFCRECGTAYFENGEEADEKKQAATG